MDYFENWDAGTTNGWVQSTTSSVVVRSGVEGNPAGSLAVRRSLTQPIFDIGVTSELPAVSDDYTGAAAWMFSFDAKHDTGNFTDMWLRFRFQGPAFDGWYLDMSDAFPNSWQSYSAMFDPTWTHGQAAANGWVDETGGTVSWQQLMTDVYHPEIRFILGDQLDALAHVDNVQLKAVPEPRPFLCLGLVALGVLAWKKVVVRDRS